MPPLVTVAVKQTMLPSQNGFVGVEMEMVAGIPALTTMIIWLEVAGLPLAHAALDVTTQVTASLLAGVYVYVELFVPTFEPFFFH